MGQPKRKQSKMRSRLRRGSKSVNVPQLSKDPADGILTMRHRVNPDTGMYRNRQVIEVELN